MRAGLHRNQIGGMNDGRRNPQGFLEIVH